MLFVQYFFSYLFSEHVEWNIYKMCRDTRKPVFWVPDEVRLKPGCVATENSRELQKVEGFCCLCSKNKDAGQLILPSCYSPFTFMYAKNKVFP